MEQERLEKSCGCVILHGSGETLEVLLIQHLKGKHWSFPKGHVESGESERQTALREVREETGLEVRILRDFRATCHYLTKKRIPKEVVYFLAASDTKQVTIQPEEIGAYEWMSVPEAGQRLTFERDRRVLAKAAKIIK